MHSHHHSHSHDHHQHAHQAPAALKQIRLAMLANFAFACIELAGGIWTNSAAVLANALHDLGDALSLGLAYILQKKSGGHSNAHFSYGYARVSLGSALITAVVLVLGSIGVLAQAIPRLMHPEQPKAPEMIGLAILGLSMNAFIAWRMRQGSSLNERLLTWHLVEDVLGWTVTLVIGVVMTFFDAPLLDPLLSILFTLFILRGVIRGLGQTGALFLQAVPQEVALDKVKAAVLGVAGVCGVHDLHVWSLDGASHVLTLHAVVAPEMSPAVMNQTKDAIRKCLEGFGRLHSTIELEWEGDHCATVDCVRI